MVLKAQVYSIDVLVATMILIVMIFCALGAIKERQTNAIGNYENIRLQQKLLQATEMLITTPEKGFVKYENNTARHHVIDTEKVRLNKESLLLEKYEVCLTISADSYSYGKCSHYATKIIRYAVCGDEICKLELSARLS